MGKVAKKAKIPYTSITSLFKTGIDLFVKYDIMYLIMQECLFLSYIELFFVPTININNWMVACNKINCVYENF